MCVHKACYRFLLGNYRLNVYICSVVLTNNTNYYEKVYDDTDGSHDRHRS
jgi:hypothetical protein